MEKTRGITRYTVRLFIPTSPSWEKQWTHCYNVFCSESGVVRFFTSDHKSMVISGVFIVEEEQNEAS